MGVGDVAVVMDDRRPKYYCRICKKGFGCGQALGGHMRAHGINDDLITAVQTEEDDSDFSPSKGECKRTYSLRSNPSRQKTSRVCKGCGKEFSSWNSFLEHGKCTSDVEDFGIGESSEMLDSPRCMNELDEDNDDDEDEEINENNPCGGGWMKGKRTKRCKAAGGASEEEDLAATCLVMLSAARVEPMAVVTEMEESCASASREEERKARPMAAIPPTAAVTMNRGGFECKACKRVFNSHQALGGHRASHKKVKGCFAAKLETTTSTAVDIASIDMHPLEQEATTDAAVAATDFTARLAIVPFDNSTPLAVAPLRKKPKLHECTICHRIFTSGQALGGHKRCHWLTSTSSTAAALPPDSTSISNLHQLAMFEKPPLDLNMPVSVDMGGTLALDLAATALCLQTLNNGGSNCKGNTQNKVIKPKVGINADVVDDEAESKVKLAKLSELKDVVGSGGEWLKVGIGSNPNNEP